MQKLWPQQAPFLTILSFDLQVWPWPSTYLEKRFKWHFNSSSRTTVPNNFVKVWKRNRLLFREPNSLFLSHYHPLLSLSLPPSLSFSLSLSLSLLFFLQFTNTIKCLLLRESLEFEWLRNWSDTMTLFSCLILYLHFSSLNDFSFFFFSVLFILEYVMFIILHK